MPVEPGFTIGHEFVGTVLAAGADVERVAVGDRVLGCFHTACATCAACLRGDYHRCERGRTFGHGSKLGDLQGAQAEQLLVPRANLTLRRVPEGMSDDVALFAGDVMGTGYHAVAHAGMRSGDTVAVLGLGPVGLCAVQAAQAGGATRVFAIDSVAQRLEMAASFGAVPVHLTEEEPKRAVRAATDGRGVDVVVDAVGDPAPLALAISLARDAGTVSGIGAYAGRGEVPLGLAWLKGLTLRLGLANVIAHVDRVLALIEAGKLDPGAARHPPHEARRGRRGLRALRPPRSAEDRPHAVAALLRLRCRRNISATHLKPRRSFSGSRKRSRPLGGGSSVGSGPSSGRTSG